MNLASEEGEKFLGAGKNVSDFDTGVQVSRRQKREFAENFYWFAHNNLAQIRLPANGGFSTQTRKSL